MKVKELVIETTNGELIRGKSLNIEIENNVLMLYFLESGCTGYPLYNISNYSFMPEDNEVE